MDLLVASINAVVVAVDGGVVALLGKGRFDAIDRKIDRVEARLGGRVDSLGARLDGRIDALQSSMDAMRSDLTQVALVVGCARALRTTKHTRIAGVTAMSHHPVGRFPL